MSLACCTCMGPTAPALCCPWFTSLERGLIQYYLRHHCCRRLTAGPALTTAIQHASSVFEFCDGHFVIKLRARCAKSIMLRLKTKTQPILHKIALLSSDVESLAEACRRFLSGQKTTHFHIDATVPAKVKRFSPKCSTLLQYIQNMPDFAVPL